MRPAGTRAVTLVGPARVDVLVDSERPLGELIPALAAACGGPGWTLGRVPAPADGGAGTASVGGGDSGLAGLPPPGLAGLPPPGLADVPPEASLAGWEVWDGHRHLRDHAATLRELGVVDGSVLVLRSAAVSASGSASGSAS